MRGSCRAAQCFISRPEGQGEDGDVEEAVPGQLGNPAQVVTQMRLPRLDWCEPVLAVEVEVPAGAVCGEPFPILLRLSNRTMEPLEIGITCLEAPGILFAGTSRGPFDFSPLLA